MITNATTAAAAVNTSFQRRANNVVEVEEGQGQSCYLAHELVRTLSAITTVCLKGILVLTASQCRPKVCPK